MDLECRKNALDAYDIGTELVLTQEESAETIVPDYCPDIARIIDTEGTVFLHRRELSGGRAEVHGTVRVNLLYIPEGEGGIRTLEFALPFTAATESGAMGESTFFTAETVCAQLETRLINPRKLSTRCRLVTSITGYCREVRGLTWDVDAPPELGVEKRQEREKINLLTEIAEKDFTFSDHWDLSAGREGAAEILRCRCGSVLSESKAVGGKLFLKGVFPITLLYRSTSGQCCSASTELPFSQVLDLEGDGEGAAAEVRLCFTGSDVSLSGEEDGRHLSVALSLHATAILRREVELTLLSDLYSTAYELSYETEPLVLNDFSESSVRRQSARELLEIGVVAESLLHVSVACGTVSAVREGEGGSFRCACRLRALYLDEGGVPLVAERSVEVSCPMDWPEDGHVMARAVCPEEPQGSLGERGIEVRFTVEFHAQTCRKKRRVAITAVQVESGKVLDFSALPSLVLRSMGQEETLWTLAKRYRTTASAILQANGLEEEREAGGGQLLLIPRKRP